MTKKKQFAVVKIAWLGRWAVASAFTSLLVACGGGSGGSAGGGTGEPVASNPSAPRPTPHGGEPTLEVAPRPVSVLLPSPGADPIQSVPPAQQIPMGINFSAPGVAVVPTMATSSRAQGGNTAAKAIDGDSTTRWESFAENNAWISFDFGAKTQIGYMRLVWENAYGKEYALQSSDDGQTWYQLRYVLGGKGGVEEFFNLNANARYLRLQGVARATQYGYSLFDVSFKSPGSDNTMANMATTAVAFPANGSGRQPLPAPTNPIETIQFSLPDGTLVTRWGMVGRSRHARERGEEWNEVGFGPNATVDGAGNPRDGGPGAHLNFVANYFKNRTWGVEFIDNSKVAGVAKPRLVINHYFQQPQRGGGLGFVRDFTNPNVTGFGWMSPADLLDDTAYTKGGQGIAACPVVPKPPQNALRSPTSGYNGVIGANNGCSWVLDHFPAHNSVVPNANGVLVPNGPRVASRELVAGDALEFTSSFFSTRGDMNALGDSGDFRYYTNELTYVMGEGLRPWYGVQPRLMNKPLPLETLQGGLGSVSYDYADNPSFMFQQPHNHIGMQNMQRFVEGRRWIHSNMWTGEHTESGNDRNEAAVGLQGPLFNQSTCVGCHISNGRGAAPSAINQRLDTMAVRTTTVDGNGQQLPHPRYGLAVQMNARPVSGVAKDWGTGVRVGGFDTRNVTLADGTVVELRKPRIAFDGVTPSVFSLRSAQPMIGMGLLEAIPDAEILSRVRSSPDADGVKGTANFAFDPETGAVRLGRFGWKASKVSLRHQVAAAALTDMSVTSPIYPNRECMAGPARCSAQHRVDRGLTEEALQSISHYLALLAVPAQRSVESGFPAGVAPLPHLKVNSMQVAAGAAVFAGAKCVACHTSQVRTGNGTEFAELRNQLIRPYTNLLLHDMGPDMADNLVEGQATGSMWRTPPLWGLGYTEAAAAKGGIVGYLHDGRARTLTEAILWHGGEATTSRLRFEALSTSDRQALLAFLKSL